MTSHSEAIKAPGRSAGPQKVGRFVIEREIGRGGMGIVYLARDPLLGRPVAVKVLSQSEGGTAGRARLLREAQALARLTHPNVVAVHDVGEHEGHVYVAMEYLPGKTLREWQPGRSPRERLRAYLAAGRGLAAAHRAGFIHRDFKAANVLVADDGRVCLLDFGLARASSDTTAAAPLAWPEGDAVSLESPLTVAGTIMGTPVYMPPEQIDGAQVGPAADQFAFCVSLWEALTGARPFAGPDLARLRASIQAGPPQVTEAAWRREVLLALRRGLLPDPSDRYPDLDACLAAIEAAAGDDGFDLDVSRKQRRALLLAVAALAAVVEVCLLTGLLTPQRTAAALLRPATAALLLLGGVVFAGRRSLAQNAINRRVAMITLGMAVLMFGDRLIGVRFEAPHAHVLSTDLAILGALVSGAATREAPWLGLVAGVQFLGSALCASFPAAASHVFTLDGLTSVALLAWFWER